MIKVIGIIVQLGLALIYMNMNVMNIHSYEGISGDNNVRSEYFN